MKTSFQIIILVLASASGICMGQGERITLWQGKMPVKAKEAGEERYEQERIYNVRLPEMAVYRPDGKNARKSDKPAVLIFPGGAYHRLAVIKEGEKTARKLNSLGITAFVVKYRLKEFGHPAPLLDGLRAIRLVRDRAEEWGVDKNRIGVLGFSAGGHLAATIATQWNNAFLKQYGFDGEDHKPDFVGLIYPVIAMKPPLAHQNSQQALLGESPTKQELEFNSPELNVNSRTPPAFLVHGSNDTSVPVENSLMFYRALQANNIPVAMHILQNGPHGFGLGSELESAKYWPDYFAAWLKANGFLDALPGDEE